MQQATPHRAFAVTVAWTLALLFLGSVVHATESSLACPDWPTCFGTMVPEMEGGVFWEHLHRLVAGGLVLLFVFATVLAVRGDEPRWIVRSCLAGIALLLVQSVFGGLTVLYRLPDAVSTSHLGMAFLFLGLAAVLTVATSPRRREGDVPGPTTVAVLRRLGVWTAAAVFGQSILGGVVRHTDSGMACGRGMLCNGGLMPSAWTHEIGVHWLHRFAAFAVAGLVVWMAMAVLRTDPSARIRRMAVGAIVLVVGQVALGFLSAWTILAVVPVSLHTLVAAALFGVTAALAAEGRIPVEPAAAPAPADTVGQTASP